MLFTYALDFFDIKENHGLYPWKKKLIAMGKVTKNKTSFMV